MKRLLSYRVANLQGQGKRDYQEDAFSFVNALDVTCIREEGLFVVAADGMGGMAGGERASKTVIQTVTSDFRQMDRSGNLGRQLAESAIHASREVYSLLNGVGGSTIVAGIFYQERLHFVSVGDSYIWLLRNKELIRLNQPHTVKDDVYLDTIRDGSMNPFSGRNNGEAEALTQFVGKGGDIMPDYNRRPFVLEADDVLVFCSDGVGSVLTESEAFSCLLDQTPEQACRYMDKLITEKNYRDQDNYTALVVKCGY